MKNNPDRTNQDPGGYFPGLEEAEGYAATAVENAYGQDRVRACRSVLTPEILSSLRQPPVVLDFGIGDGLFLSHLALQPGKVFGVDTSPHMLGLAERNLTGTSFVGLEGSVEKLAGIPDETFDLALCVDVEGYLEEVELYNLYSELGRVVRRGGCLVVQTGNELFDLYALNQGTEGFFQKNFATEVGELLTLSKTTKWSTAPRRNPLNFSAQLSLFGFEEVAQSFSQWHERIPSALVEFEGMNLLEARLAARNHEIDPNQLGPLEGWKALFQCSMFASLSRRV